MDPKPLSVSQRGMARTTVLTPTYPFPGTSSFEQIVAAVQLLLLSISRGGVEKDLDLPVDMMPIEERLEQSKM